nr:MFS transporter [Pseudofrankia sp. BMG5.36]
MYGFDFNVVNVAIPSVRHDLNAGTASLELIVGGYAFAYATGLVTGGRLGDLFGYRTMFLVGVAGFTVASVACGMAGTPGELVAARLVQGLTAAAMVPQVLALITHVFPVEERTRALAWFSVTASLSGLLGQVLGGLLLDANVLGLGWRVIFFMNLPVGVIVCVVGVSGQGDAASARARARCRWSEVGPVAPGQELVVWCLTVFGPGLPRSRQARSEEMLMGAAGATDVASGTAVVRGACPHDCPDTCAMVITVTDGKAVKVAGDRQHPFTRGGLCVKVDNYLDRVYSPDRVLYPLRRTGPKGSGRFERISWDEALDEIAERFRAISAEFGPESIMPCSYLGTQGILNGLNVGDPFFAKLGATIAERTYCDSGSCTAYMMTIGDSAGVDPESLVHSKFILIWACNVMSTNLHLWPFIAEARRRGATVVVVDPVKTRTANAADWHIPIRPGTDGALALAMMHVIISEGLTDEDYIARYTVGYDELVARVQQYTPEWAAEETGVPAEDIRRLARAYAGSQPSVIRIGVAVERHAGGGQAVRALSCLPALVGAWRKPGGGILQLPLWAFPVNWGAMMHPELLEPGKRVVNQYLLGRALTGGLDLDPPIKALMVYNSNPVVVCPDQGKLLEGLRREDLFTVVSEQFMTDTAEFADIVLPATTQLEQDDIMFSWGHLYATYNQRSIEPLGEAVPNTELFRRLAARMGFTDPVFRRTDAEMIAEAFDWSAPAMQGITVESLKERGWQRLNVPLPDEYAPHAEGNFPTASGKVEFLSSAAAAGNFVVPLFRQGSNDYQPGGRVDPLPHYIPPRESTRSNGGLAAKYPLNLLTPKAHAYLNSSGGNMPFQRRVQGEPTILISPQDASERRIVTGDYVRVFNDRGSFVVQAKVDGSVLSGVTVSSYGGWRKHATSWSTVASVNPTVFADLGNAPTFSDTLVQIEKAPHHSSDAV